MSTIVTRAGKGSPLTNDEVDANFNNLNNTKLEVGGAITVKDNVFTLQDDADATKQAQFQVSGVPTATTNTYTLPSLTTSLAGLGGTETFTGSKTFSSTTLVFGSSAVTSSQSLGSGATTTGNTKTVNVGTGGLSGSTTAITVGSANGSTTTMLGSTVIGGLSGNQSLQVNNVASAVNYAQIVGAVTGGAPTYSAQGTDTNIGLYVAPKGTAFLGLGGSTSGTAPLHVFANPSNVNYTEYNGGTSGGAPAIVTGGADANVALSFSTKGSSGFSFYTNGYGSQAVAFSHTASAVNYLQLTGAATGAAPTLSAQGSDTNIGLVLNGKGTGVVALGGSTAANSGLQISPVASAVNYALMTGATTGTFPSWSAQGTDTNIGFRISTKGIANINFMGSNFGQYIFTCNAVSSAVNFLQVLSAATTGAPELSAQGSDTNIDLLLRSKGTGVVALGGSTVANSAVQVVPTASSVNYLTLTGGPTGNGGNIAIGGTDTNANLVLKSKGSFNITFQTSNGAKMADIAPSSTGFGVNGLLLTAAGTGNAPELSAQGSDANIDLKLTPKGTGSLTINSTAAITVPAGTTAQRPTGVTGMFRYNTTTPGFEGYNGTTWGAIGGGATASAITINTTTVSANTTIAAGNNGFSVGPIVVNSGATVTVTAGQRWVVI